jgi:hypothetical protein
VYAALCQATGPSTDSYDHHKGTYNFDFLMTLKKGELSQLYCARVMHVRSSIEIFLYQIISPEVEIAQSAGQPLVPVSILTQTLVDWLRDLVQDLGPTKDFVLSASCDALIMGCFDRKYFIETLSDIELFQQAVEKYKSRLKQGGL